MILNCFPAEQILQLRCTVAAANGSQLLAGPYFISAMFCAVLYTCGSISLVRFRRTLIFKPLSAVAVSHFFLSRFYSVFHAFPQSIDNFIAIIAWEAWNNSISFIEKLLSVRISYLFLYGPVHLSISFILNCFSIFLQLLIALLVATVHVLATITSFTMRYSSLQIV